MKYKVNPLDCKSGATTKVSFRCNAHVSKKYCKKNSRREFSRMRKDYV